MFVRSCRTPVSNVEVNGKTSGLEGSECQLF